MNFKFAPDFMWSCYPNSIGASANMTQGVGAVNDLTFAQYAQYMARIVSYYNKGSMTTETGTVITNPAGTSRKIVWWELWNEPDLNNETPCAPSTGYGLTYQQYATMWNAVTAAMLAVDPGLKFVGPATAGSQFGSSTSTGNQYVDYLMANSVVKPSALSFHGYGYWDNTVTDKWILDGDNSEPQAQCCGGIIDLLNGVKRVRNSYPNLPIWLTEINVNADWGADTKKRPWSEFSAAWWGATFAAVAPEGAGIIHHYNVADGPQFGLFDESANKTYMAYYVFQLLNQAFPQGSVLLSTSTSQTNVVSLAARKPDGTISVMIVNRQLASNSVKSSCGAGGVATDVTLNLQGIASGTATIQQLDKTNVNCTTNAASAPSVRTTDVSQGVTVSFPGYGLAIVSITGSQGGSTATPVPATVTATATSTTAPATATATSTAVPATSTTAPATATSTKAPATATSAPATATPVTQPSQAPAPMSVISRGVPAYASHASGEAGQANDADYASVWRSGVAPSAGSPQWLAYDLSQVPTATRANVVYAWYNDSTGDYYNAAAFYSLPRTYTIEAHSGPGAAQGVTAAPTSGWVTLTTVTDNLYTGRSHPLNLAGYSWVRIKVTAARGGSGNNDVSLQADVHDASGGQQDSWLMLGDSITMEGFLHHNIDGAAWSGGNYQQLVQAARPAYFPLVLDGGNGGTTMAWATANKAALLAPFSGRYVGLAYGTNDANQSGALTSSQITAYYTDLLALVDYVLSQNKVPVVPKIPWGCGGLGTNAKLLNDYVEQRLFVDRPQVVRGPDLWTFFRDNPSLLHDCIHPTYSASSGQLNGYEHLQRLWRDAMVAQVYNGTTTTFPTPTTTPVPPTATSLPATATSVPPTATKTPVPLICSPRPMVSATLTRVVPGRLDATIVSTATSGAPNNRLRALRFGASTNALIRLGGQVIPGGTRVPLTARPSQAQFTVQRLVAGTAAMVPVIVEDDCGDWSTFVGGGPTAF